MSIEAVSSDKRNVWYMTWLVPYYVALSTMWPTVDLTVTFEMNLPACECRLCLGALEDMSSGKD
jgi:hypothetical protein